MRDEMIDFPKFGHIYVATHSRYTLLHVHSSLRLQFWQLPSASLKERPVLQHVSASIPTTWLPPAQSDCSVKHTKQGMKRKIQYNTVYLLLHSARV